MKPILSKKNCFNLMNDFYTMDTVASTTTSIISDAFKDSPSYVEVWQNFDYSKTFDCWLENGTSQNNTIGWKKLISYPYSTTQYQIGNYVIFDYGDEKKSIWLMEAFDKQIPYNSYGRIWKCNQKINFRNEDGSVSSVWASFQDKMFYTNFKYMSVTIPSASIVLLTQQNGITNKYAKNMRFLFSGDAYRITQILKQVNENFMEIYLRADMLLPEDDIVNNIAWNEIIETVITNETIIEPDISEILQGASQSYSVYKYVNGLPIDDVFSVVGSEVPDKSYILTVIDGNNFRVQNLKEEKKPLLITCTNQTEMEKPTPVVEVTTKVVCLRGEY